ncbi:MAG: phosphoribosylanthranilate isomerase [Candidatus Helarchaeota archaeon]|nr:phosphoribosylanthranilate isomerase [Candidatus Helarchaeota archaeon]
MSRVRVKICGITSLKDLKTAVEAGTDAVGMVVDVSQSPRNVSITQAKKLIEATPVFIDTVAVTIPENVAYLMKIYKELNPSFIQVHGLENSLGEIREKLSDAHLIGGIQVKSGLDIDYVVKITNYFDAILLDSFVPGKKGGSGVTHDWEISKRIKEAIHPKPLILAGGLTPQNIKTAINTVKPYAVDVSSGVEASPGIKDRTKVIEFIKNAKEVEI